MNQDLQTSLVLALTGMATVFVILSLIVLTGNILIRVVGRVTFFSEKVAEHKKQEKAGTTYKALPPSKLAAIIAAADLVTDGKGKIESIEKLS